MQKLGPVVEDLFELLVDQGVGKEVIAGLGGHGPVEQGIDGKTDETGWLMAGDVLIRLGRRGHDAVEQPQELLERAYLWLTERGQVLVAPGFLEHGVGLGMQRRVGMDQVPQLGNGGHQRPRLLGHVVLDPPDPALDMGAIAGDPATGTGLVQSGFHCLVHGSLSSADVHAHNPRLEH